MIEELMLHGRLACESRPPRRQSDSRRTFRHAAAPPPVNAPSHVPARPERHPRGIRIDWDTPIIPHIVAEGVCEEVTVWLQSPLPRRWVRELAAYANTVYAHNDRFRRRIHGAGNLGRDYLWMFMRHWLASMLRQRRPQLHARLPASFNIGQPLPDARPGASAFQTTTTWVARSRN
jgi:hypothetical protein